MLGSSAKRQAVLCLNLVPAGALSSNLISNGHKVCDSIAGSRPHWLKKKFGSHQQCLNGSWWDRYFGGVSVGPEKIIYLFFGFVHYDGRDLA